VLVNVKIYIELILKCSSREIDRESLNNILFEHSLTPQDINYLFRVYTVFYNNCFVIIVFNSVRLRELCIILLPFMVTV
jgi:hypothetical protein